MIWVPCCPRTGWAEWTNRLWPSTPPQTYPLGASVQPEADALAGAATPRITAAATASVAANASRRLVNDIPAPSWRLTCGCRAAMSADHGSGRCGSRFAGRVRPGRAGPSADLADRRAGRQHVADRCRQAGDHAGLVRRERLLHLHRLADHHDGAPGHPA